MAAIMADFVQHAPESQRPRILGLLLGLKIHRPPYSFYIVADTGSNYGSKKICNYRALVVNALALVFLSPAPVVQAVTPLNPWALDSGCSRKGIKGIKATSLRAINPSASLALAA